MFATPKMIDDAKIFLKSFEANVVNLEISASRSELSSQLPIFKDENGQVQKPDKIETVEYPMLSSELDRVMYMDVKDVKIKNFDDVTKEYAVVSGLTRESLKAMKEQGIEYKTLVETAPNVFQATVAFEQIKSVYEAKNFEHFEKALNSLYGDEKATKDIVIPGFSPDRNSDFVPRFAGYDGRSYVQSFLSYSTGDVVEKYDKKLAEQQKQKLSKEPVKEPVQEPTQPVQEPTQHRQQEPQVTAKIVEPSKTQETVEKTIASQTPDIVASILAAVKAIINAVVKTITLGICQPFPNAMAQKPTAEQQKDLTKEQSKPEKTIETKEQSQPERDMSQVPPAPAFAPGVENAPFANPQNPETIKNQIAKEAQEKAKAQEKEQQQKGKGKTKEKTKSKERSGPSL